MHEKMECIYNNNNNNTSSYIALFPLGPKRFQHYYYPGQWIYNIEHRIAVLNLSSLGSFHSVSL